MWRTVSRTPTPLLAQPCLHGVGSPHGPSSTKPALAPSACAPSLGFSLALIRPCPKPLRTRQRERACLVWPCAGKASGIHGTRAQLANVLECVGSLKASCLPIGRAVQPRQAGLWAATYGDERRQFGWYASFAHPQGSLSLQSQGMSHCESKPDPAFPSASAPLASSRYSCFSDGGSLSYSMKCSSGGTSLLLLLTPGPKPFTTQAMARSYFHARLTTAVTLTVSASDTLALFQARSSSRGCARTQPIGASYE